MPDDETQVTRQGFVIATGALGIAGVGTTDRASQTEKLLEAETEDAFGRAPGDFPDGDAGEDAEPERSVAAEGGLEHEAVTHSVVVVRE